MAKSSFSQTLSQLEDTLDEYFGKKAPQMPDNIKELIVKFAPYLVILGLLFTIPGLLAVVGIGGFASMMAPFGGMNAMRAVTGMWLGIILMIPVVILEAMALPGLFAQTKQGWRYMYLASLVSVVANVLQFNLIGAVIGAIISFYILFQIKKEYK